VFVDSGFGAGLIQRQEIDQDDETSVFYLNVTAGIFFTTVLCILSPLVAAFYAQPVLAPILIVSSCGIAIGSFGNVQNTLLTRAMDFRTQAKVTMGATLLSGLVGLGMAWQGCGIWSLVGQSLMQSGASVLLVWRWSPWRPRGRFRWSAIRALWPFAWRLLAAAQLNCIFENLYSMVIGRVYKPADLGFYTRASTLSMLPAGSVTTMTHRVMFPAFSSAQDDKMRLKHSFRTTLLAMSAVYFPMMMGMAAVADPMVTCLFTDKWRPCVPYFQVLCFVGMLYPLHALHLNVLMAQGRADLFLRLEVIKKALVLVALATTFRLGVAAIVYGSLVFTVVSLLLNSYYTRRLLHYGWREQIRDLLPIVATSLGMAFLVWGMGFVPLNAWVLLASQAAFGVILYAGASLILRKHGYEEVWATAIRVWTRRSAAAEPL
jgi:O-antigen/teichoic acid export membrane protein